MPTDMKKVTEASKKISAVLDDIDTKEKERNRLRRQRDALNEDITSITQQISATKTTLDLAVDDLRKAVTE